MPRSGTNYLYALLSAMDQASRREKVDYGFEVDPFSGLGKWDFDLENRIPNNLLHFQQRLLTGGLDKLSPHFFVLSHYPAIRWETLFPIWRMKPVVVVRHPFHAAESLYLYFKKDKNNQNASFVQEKADIIVRFFNFWGKARNNYLLVRYEDLVSEPVEVIKKIYGYWGIPFHYEKASYAADACKRREMISKIPSEQRNTNKRVSVRKKDMPQDLLQKTKGKISQNVRYSLSYSLR